MISQFKIKLPSINLLHYFFSLLHLPHVTYYHYIAYLFILCLLPLEYELHENRDFVYYSVLRSLNNTWHSYNHCWLYEWINIFEEESQDINGLKSWIIRFFSVKIPFILILIVTRPWINDVSHRTYVYRNTKTCKVIFHRKHQLLITYMRCKLHLWVIYMILNNHIYDLKKLRCRTVNWQYSRGYNRIFFIYFIYH